MLQVYVSGVLAEGPFTHGAVDIMRYHLDFTSFNFKYQIYRFSFYKFSIKIQGKTQHCSNSLKKEIKIVSIAACIKIQIQIQKSFFHLIEIQIYQLINKCQAAVFIMCTYVFILFMADVMRKGHSVTLINTLSRSLFNN